MNRETLAQIKLISNLLPDPLRAERAMLYRLNCCVKMCKKTLTRNLLSTLCKRRTGLKVVEQCIQKLYKQEDNKRVNKVVNFIMKEKLEDAENEVRKAERNFSKASVEYTKCVQRMGATDRAYIDITKKETERLWTIGKKKNQNKIETLMRRRKNENDKRQPHNKKNYEMKSVCYKDKDLERFEKQRGEICKNKPEKYGGVQIDEKVEAMLSKEPKFMMYNKIDSFEIEVEIEKGMAKARYELMNRSDGEEESVSNEDVAESISEREIEYNKVLEYNNLRATDIPTVQRLIEPKLGSIEQEIVMENTKEKLLECVQMYKEAHCNGKGDIKEDNIDCEERQGLKQIKKDIKDKKIVVFTTDKSGKFSVDTPDNYMKAMELHTSKDIEVEGTEKEKKIETTMNHHMRQFHKMFNTGSTHNHEERVIGATTSTNVPAPPMYGLRKDHKPHTDKIKGPPVRPVCGASEAPNSRLSNFLSRIVNDYADSIDIATECKSSEEMKAAFESYNNESPEVKENCQIISMDVKALYPSMDVDEVCIAVREMIESSEKQVEGVNWNEVGKYISIIPYYIKLPMYVLCSMFCVLTLFVPLSPP